MKKMLFVIFVIFMPCLGLAKNNGLWKGFVDFSAGYDSNKHINALKYDYSLSHGGHVVCGINFSGGYQISPQWFTGVGFGCYTSGIISKEFETREFYALYTPVYADVRWTPEIGKRFCPFVDMKIGYQFGWPGEGWIARYKNGVYCLPSMGIRFGKATGFNLGIGYNVSIGRKYYVSYEDKYIGESHQGVFLLILGVDF